MRKQYITRKITMIAAIFTLISSFVLAGCNQAKVATIDDFTKACENDGLTVNENPDKSSVSGYADLETYCTAEHGTEDILVQFMEFSDEDSARAAFEAYQESINPGPAGTTSEVDEAQYTAITATADSRYTKAILYGKQIISAAGPTMYKSELDRIILKFGFQ